MNILINEQCTVEYDEWERGGYLDEMDGIKKCIYISIQVRLSKNYTQLHHATTVAIYKI